jgi:hypothetical protein
MLPEGWHTITPRIVVNQAREFVDFLKQAFLATGNYEDQRPTVVQIGDSKIMVTEAGVRPASNAFLYVYVAIAMRRVSPGVYTASLLYLPFSSYAFFAAWRNRVSRKSMALAFLLGVALNCAVVVGVWFMSDTPLRTAL